MARVVRRVKAALSALRGRNEDRRRVTYALTVPLSAPTLHTYFRPVPLNALARESPRIAALSAHGVSHCFDLLGSGWVQVRHGRSCRGLEGHRYESGQAVRADLTGRWLQARINPTNLSEASRVWGLLRAEYVPIDWHLDFKSGYRWSEQTWYRDIRVAPLPAVDIKVPWELARMQHLPQLALAHALAIGGSPSLQPSHVYAIEFRNEVLDFIATNPPRFGVNWTSAMDVAIRVVNWLVAYDLFLAHGAEFDPEFMAVFARSVYEHGRHIMGNLEWTPEFHGNHYLANVVGVLFAAAYLPRSPETDAWLAFAIHELLGEVSSQFTRDGASFEGSTSYHRLATEFVVYATALTLALPLEKQEALQAYDHRLKPGRPPLRSAPLPLFPAPNGNGLIPFPEWYLERLERMGEFVMDLAKPSGRSPQLGDNDSGRFLKLVPAVTQRTVAEARQRYGNLAGYLELPDHAIYWDEDHLNHRHIIDALSGLFDRPDFAAFAGEHSLETAIMSSLLRGRRFPSYRDRETRNTVGGATIGSLSVFDWIDREFEEAHHDQQQALEIPAPGADLRDGLSTHAYPYFGVFLFRSRRLYLAVRCGPVGQDGVGGHSHNDQLSLELSVDGQDLITDPGTYLYTALPDRRNEYRSMKAHFGPRIDGSEQARLDLGLFRLESTGHAECLRFGKEGFAGVWRDRRRAVYCVIRISAEVIQLRYFARGCRLLRATSPSWQEHVPRIPFSPGYGVILPWRMNDVQARTTVHSPGACSDSRPAHGVQPQHPGETTTPWQ